MNMNSINELHQCIDHIIHFPSFFNHLSIRAKLTLFTTVLIAVTSLANIYFYYQAYIAMEDYNNTLKDYSNINNLSIQLIRGRDALSGYGISKERDELEIFKESQRRTTRLIRTIFRTSSSQDTYLLSRAIDISHASYQREIRKMLTFTLGSPAYFRQFAQVKKVSAYLENYIKQLLDVKLTEGEWYQHQLGARVRLVRSLNITGIIALAVVSFLFVLIFSRSITGPLKKLTDFSASVARGDFELEPLAVDSSTDVNILAVGFNKMVQSIQEMIREITAKSDLERKLHEEQYKNLKIAQQLDEARFLALQSQINPHFLFNTLNTVMRTAMFENAAKTGALIESLAELFRYNLDSQNTEVVLREELDIIRQYIAIQQVRFRRRVGFELICPAELTDIVIPRFTIQPLVENAIIHGIEPKEAGGRVRIRVFAREDRVMIKIIDNGMGIARDRVGTLLSGTPPDAGAKKQGHTTGIGLANVRERLLLFCKDPRCIEIRSRENWGTVITIRISRSSQRRIHDQTVDC
jgi:two-component system sensor histidine kinase YesM